MGGNVVGSKKWETHGLMGLKIYIRLKMANIGSVSIFKTNLTLEVSKSTTTTTMSGTTVSETITTAIWTSRITSFIRVLLRIALSVVQGRRAYHLCIFVVERKTSFMTNRVKLLSLQWMECASYSRLQRLLARNLTVVLREAHQHTPCDEQELQRQHVYQHILWFCVSTHQLICSQV